MALYFFLRRRRQRIRFRGDSRHKVINIWSLSSSDTSPFALGISCHEMRDFLLQSSRREGKVRRILKNLLYRQKAFLFSSVYLQISSLKPNIMQPTYHPDFFIPRRMLFSPLPTTIICQCMIRDSTFIFWRRVFLKYFPTL